MKIQTYQVGQMQCNCYFLIDDHDCVIIDPGDSAETLLEEVSRQNLNVHALIATHGHFDHIMAAGEMQLALNVPFYIHADDEFLLSRLESTAAHFLGYEPYVIKPQVVKHISSSKLHLPPFNFEIILTPGHTPGSVCLYQNSAGMAFVGDLLFHGGGVGRFDFSYSNKQDLFSSINHLVKKLPGETIIHSGHGESSILEEEESLLRQQGLLR